MRRRILPSLLCVAGALVLGACAAQKRLMKVTPTANPETSYKRIVPKGAPQYPLQSVNAVIEPKPKAQHFAAPVYPPSLARPGMPPVTVKAHLVFDKEGRVKGTAIVSNSWTGAGAKLFADAVRAATSRWAFTPLVFKEITGGGDTPLTTTAVAKPFSLWYEFYFRMVNGKPIVSASKRQLSGS